MPKRNQVADVRFKDATDKDGNKIRIAYLFNRAARKKAIEYKKQGMEVIYMPKRRPMQNEQEN